MNKPLRERTLTAAQGESLESELVRTRMGAEPDARSGVFRRIIGAVMAVLVVSGALGGVSYVWLHRTAPPITTSAADPNSELVIASNASFGQISVNGKVQSGRLPMLVKLANGPNTITFTIRPFHTQVCSVSSPVVSLPPAAGSGVYHSCEGFDASGVLFDANGQTVKHGLVFVLSDVDMSFTDIPSLDNALSAKLSTLPISQTVPAGDYVATGIAPNGAISSVRVAEQLTAELSVTRTTKPDSCYCASVPYIPGDSPYHSLPDGIWITRASLTTQWEFVSSSGQAVGETPARDDIYTVIFKQDPSGTWAVSDLPDDQSLSLSSSLTSRDCTYGATAFRELMTAASLQTKYYAEPNSLDTINASCSFTVRGLQSGTAQGEIVWRWGVLLAGDATAHKNFPSLPIAPKDEIDAVGGLPPVR